MPDPSKPNKFLNKRSGQALNRLLTSLAHLPLPAPLIMNGAIHPPLAYTNQAMRSSRPDLGASFHVIRLDRIITPTRCEEIVQAFRQFDIQHPFKHIPKSHARTYDSNDINAHYHPYHLGIVKRMSNSTGVSKDTTQTDRKKINNPTAVQLSRRNAAYNLLDLLEQYIAKPACRRLDEHDKDFVDHSFWVNKGAHDQSTSNGTVPGDQHRIRLSGMATAVAVGYGEASKPHIDKNDSAHLYTIIAQVSGDPGVTHFPQLNLDVHLGPGDILMAPTACLAHHARSTGSVREDRITAVLYSCSQGEQVMCLADGKVVRGVLEGLPEEDVIQVDDV